jgi:hypothetical protein
MSKYMHHWRDFASMALASIRAEGWKARRIAPDVWKVSDKRCTCKNHICRHGGHKRRHYIFNRDQLLNFAGHDTMVGRPQDYVRYSYRDRFLVIDESEVPF